MKKVVVIGAGVGGLTTAAILARAGLEVTVLEAHVYPGGCAGTFYHQGYRFDAGATLAGGFSPGGPMDLVADAAGIPAWPILPHREDAPAMLVHLPDGPAVPRWGDDRRHEARREAFGSHSEPFFRWQEEAADAMWALALRNLPWPPQSVRELAQLVREAAGWIREDFGRLSPSLLADPFRPVSAHLPEGAGALNHFVDGQLLISAQTTSRDANALYGASAFDLPRRGVVHIEGGMGAISDTLVNAVRENGGQVHFRQEVTRIHTRNGRTTGVSTRRGDHFEADLVVANLTPWNIARLLKDDAPRRLRRLPEKPHRGWGAFVVYLGIDANAVPPGTGLHHQVLDHAGFGEGSSVFLSLSPENDPSRAPDGRRAVTLSTHTALEPWWEIFEGDRDAYERRTQTYLERMLVKAGQVLPGIRDASDLILPGTPVTFQQFTRRESGWVGGFPQTNLFQTRGSRIMPGLRMVGDSIFPGQSVAAVALGGMQVARNILDLTGIPAHADRPGTTHPQEGIKDYLSA